MKKILVSLPDEIVSILDKEVVGKLGKGHSDTLRAIIMNWLSEQGYLAKGGKQKNHQQKQEHTHQNETFYTS
jgi:hypothetical protein